MSVHVRVRVGSERYALPVENVLEIAEPGRVAPVPGVGRAIVGVRNLRGEVLPIFDLATIFEIAREASGGPVIVAEQGGRRAGLVVDEVTDVASMPPPAEDSEARLLRGATLVDGMLVGIVDVPRLFAALADEEER